MQTKINEKKLNNNLVKDVYIKYAITLAVLGIVYGLLMLLVYEGIIDNYILRIMKQIGIFVIAALGLNLILGFTGQFTMGHAAFMSIGAYGSAIMTKTLICDFQIALIVGVVLAAILSAIIRYPCKTEGSS